jgi:glycerophosphoryl diester phosphodiesterase
VYKLLLLLRKICIINIKEKIIAHRGESFDAPENTLKAINLAWDRGVLAVEIDIRLTKDNEILIIHDKNTFRTSHKYLNVKRSTLKGLKAINIGYKKDSQWTNQQIPTLKEVLETVPQNGKLIIEIKSNYKILNKLHEELSRTKLLDSQIEIIAFNIKTLAKAKLLLPQFKMLYLLNLDYYWFWWFHRINKTEIIKKVKESKLDGVNVWAGKILNKEFISDFKKENLLVYVWTVDSPQKAQVLIKDGAAGIATNRAHWMTQQLNNLISINNY